LARLAGPLDRSALELGLLADSIARLEAEPVEDARLVELRGQLVGGSRAIARLRATIGWFEAQHSSLFAPIAALLAWGPGFGLAIERWRATQGARVEPWLAALAEWEALASLAAYAFENPDDPFPTLVDTASEPSGGLRLIGDALAHPLLPRSLAVANPISLGAGGRARAYVISGSNMSGKSTYLRTVGCNVVLALAGAPVRAAALELTPLRIGATLRIQDSLAAGRSRFAAELVRLRAIDELAERGPLLFLLDEIFHGTNSHDRRIGAEALLRSLVERGAIGLLTTHDLALARAAEALQSALPGAPIPATPGAPIPAINMHFRDELDADAGALRFDYCMREGVVDRSNALALMRAIGLRV
jgi:DNA mismatch repair ATPase MutS